MRTVRKVVKVDKALERYRESLADLLVTLDQNIRHHNTEPDAERREVWKAMRAEVVLLRDAAFDRDAYVHIVSLSHAASSVAR